MKLSANDRLERIPMLDDKQDDSLTLGIEQIDPVDFSDPSILVAMEQARRSISNPNLHKILEIRTAIQHFFCSELYSIGYVHPPIYMLAGCTDPLNHWTYPARVNYYGEDISVTQSLILQKILMVMLSTAGKVFWASPNIRMEMRVRKKDYKYATEFMQVDFEKRDATADEMITFISSMIQKLYAFLNEKHGPIVKDIRGELLPELSEPLPVFDVQEVKRKNSLPDDDSVERWASERVGGKPCIVTNLRREAYDCFDEKSKRFLNYDVILPPFGENENPVECLSGAERTRSIGDLKQRMQDLRYPLEYFAPFFELFSSLDQGSGKISCAGAGFGIERLTYAILGLKNVNTVYPFPRVAETKIAI